MKQASLKFLQLPPTCPADNLDYEVNNLSEALSSCSADHLEGSFDFIPSAGMGTVCPCSSWFQFLLLLPLGTAIRKEMGKNFKLLSNAVLWAVQLSWSPQALLSVDTTSLCSEKPFHHREGMGTDPIIQICTYLLKLILRKLLTICRNKQKKPLKKLLGEERSLTI